MIYTCYEMIQDCRAGKPAGWTYFLKHYVPRIRGFVAHYFPEMGADPATIERLLLALCRPESTLFQSLDPALERAFVGELRQHVVRAVGTGRAGAAPEAVIDLDTLTAALIPLTVTEKLAVWFETMRYGAEDSGRMLRMSAATAAKIRERGAELIRGSVDTWHRKLLADNGWELGQAAAALRGKDCLPAKAFLDVIDGRTTWRGREELEQHVTNCRHCLDYYCRLLEVVDVLRTATPLSETETGSYQHLLGIQPRKRSFWRRA
ncbi:MAG: hypothetical protein ABSH50_21065 [Bryobacteraceae bacterium]|jgi:hypothetical protein